MDEQPTGDAGVPPTPEPVDEHVPAMSDGTDTPTQRKAESLFRAKVRARIAALPFAAARVRADWPVYLALAKGMVRRILHRPLVLARSHPRYALALLAALLLMIGGVAACYIVREEPLPLWMTYGEGYRLVPPTLSQSGTLAIVAPEEAGAITPAQVRFEPELVGQYVASDATTTLYFKPKELPEVGAYHRVELTYGSTTIDGEFQVAEDPRILSILPSSDAETHEGTKVSVIFNRPMVPLTTRAELDQAEVPVTLTPPTEGVWKWQSTRLLQFVPKTTLTPATRYEVTVEKGFRSLDGVAVPNVRHAFTTRTLKVLDAPNTVHFDTPLAIRFNQPVDLARTARELTLTKDGERIEARVNYAKAEKRRSRLFDFFSGREKGTGDATDVLLISPQADKHGREGYWDFDTTYELHIEKMYPAAGTEVLTEPLVRTISMPTVLTSQTAASERSVHVRSDFFDPEGELVATFYEDIDKDKTQIELEGLREVRYGERCKTDEDGNEVRKAGANTCEKVENRAELRMRVDPARFAPGERKAVRYVRIVNTAGLTLTEEPIEMEVVATSLLALTATSPREGAQKGDLTRLTFCTNSPLKKPEPGALRGMLKTEGYVVYPDDAWHNSFRVEEPRHDSPCKRGDFETSVAYGLHPEKAYRFDLTLTDDFGREVRTALSFTSEPAREEYTRLTSLHKEYNVTMPGKTRLTYASENLPYVDVDICTVSPEKMLEVLETSTLPRGLPPASWCASRVTGQIDLPDTYWVNNYFYLDLAAYLADTRGQHIVTLSHPRLKDEDDQLRVERTLLSVSDLAVGEKRINWWSDPDRPAGSRIPVPDPQNLYWVLNARTLMPLSGASVTAYEATSRDEEHKTLQAYESAQTDGEGIARIPARELGTGAVIRLGSDAALVSSYADTLMYAWNPGGEGRTYLYTDRPIYRPGDKVSLKGIDRVGYDQRWRIVEDYEAPVKVYDAANKVVYEQRIAVGRYGTFATDFTLPMDASLGQYRIEAFDQYGWFDVEEYAPAAFRLTATPRAEEHIAGETAALDLDARYYFDAPVANADVEYTVVAQDYHFDRYTDEYFSFGAGWYFCYGCGYGDEFVTRGTLTLDKDGRGSVSVPLTYDSYFDKPDEKGSKLFTVIARVKDQSGRQVTGQASVIVHRGEHYLGLRTDSYVGAAGAPLGIRIKSVDTKGIPIGLSGIELTASKVEWESYRRREVDGGFYYHSEEKKTEVLRTQVSTDREGNATYAHTFSEPGEYELVVVKKDGRGNTVRTTERVYIAGPGSVDVRPLNNEALTLRLDKQNYKAGEEATVLVESPFEKARLLLTTERGSVYRTWTREVTGSLFTEKVPVEDKYAPNSYVTALLVGPGPSVKFGTTELRVDSDVHDVDIEVTPSKGAYLPGEEVELRVRTTHRGAPIQTEVSLAVVDMSVLALKGNPKKDPVRFFYDSMPLGVTTAHSAKNLLVQHDIPTGTKGGGGGDGDLATKKRGIFRDTAHWAAQVETNDAGEATVRFTLPDNLTTWQVEALGITLDSKLGVSYREFLSKKPVMAVPQRPRFIVPGDTAYLGVQLVNNTDEAVTLAASVRSDTLIVHDTDTRKVRVPARESRLVYFETEAPAATRSGVHRVTWNAEGSGYSDTVELPIPIARDRTFETVATAGVSREKRVFESIYVPEYAGPEGELTITARPTLVTSLLSAVSDIALYPYGCSEQIASRLAALASLVRAERVLGEGAADLRTRVLGESGGNVQEEIEKGIRDLGGRQTPDGGFTFYEGGVPSVPLTVEVLAALSDVREAGYRVPDDIFERAAQYLTNELAREKHYARDSDFIARVAFALSSPYVPQSAREALAARVRAIAKDEKALETLGTTALGYFANATLAVPYERSTADRFMAALENRVVVDARGAYVRDRFETRRSWFSSTEKNTALFVRAIAARGGEHPVVDGLMRHLVASRGPDGAWGSTNATAAAIDAALRLAEARKEGDVSYTLSVLLGGTERAAHTVEPKTLAQVFTHVIPLSEFAENKLSHVSLVRSDEGGTGSLYFDMALRYALPPDLAPPRDEGITVSRMLVRAGSDEPVHTAKKGELITGVLDITIPEEYRAVSVESFVPAGFEIVNYRLATESSRDRDAIERADREESGEAEEEYSDFYEPEAGPLEYPVTHEEMHDDRVFLFTEEVSPGMYRYEYTLRALIPGTYRHMPATVQEMYRPEIFGRTDGGTVTITEE